MKLTKVFKNWFQRKYEFPGVPQQRLGDDFQIIAGRKFPKDVIGYVNFDYSALEDTEWKITDRTRWDSRFVYVDMGNFCRFDQTCRKRQTWVKIKPIHKRWTILGYLPTYWRISSTIIPDETPVNGDLNRDYWPRPFTSEKEILEEKQRRDEGMSFIFSGDVWLQECYFPDPFECDLFHHRIGVSPSVRSRLFNIKGDTCKEFKYEDGKFRYI